MEKRHSNFQIMFQLIHLVKPLSGYMCLAVFLGLCGHLVASFITIFGAYALLNAVGLNMPFNTGNGMIFAVIILFAVLRGIFRYGEQACNHFIAFKLLALLRSLIFQQLRKLSPAKLEGKDKGDLISLISTDIELLEVFYAHTISPILIATLFTICLFFFFLQFHIYIALYALFAYLLVGVAQPIIASYLSRDYGMKVRQKSGTLSTYLLDSLRGLDETIQYQNGEERFQMMDDLTIDLLSDQSSLKHAAGQNVALSTLWVLLMTMGMIAVGMSLYTTNQLNMNGMLISVFAMISTFGPTIALANLGTTLQSTFAAGDRVLSILEEKPVTSDITGEDFVTYEDAELNNVSFSYHEDDVILDNVSLKFEKNKIYGIVGKSGSGKSTLLKLLMRFWEPDHGEILVSSKNVNRINTANLRDMQSYMTQETQLFNSSVYENIKLAKQDATEEEIIEAAKKASIHELISSLPQGYETPMGELGGRLSAGERQRIGLARVFLHHSDMILLDEPTSNLDSLNEAVILKSLKEETENKTVILVSHRESTMRIADEVIHTSANRIS